MPAAATAAALGAPGPRGLRCSVVIAIVINLIGHMHVYSICSEWPIRVAHVGQHVRAVNVGRDESNDLLFALYPGRFAAVCVAAAARGTIALEAFTFLWAASLLHGGTPVIDRNLTRLSQASHYFFAEPTPHEEQVGADGGSLLATVYLLPVCCLC